MNTRERRPSVIDYGHRGRAPVRTSRLALWCMFLSLTACPCVAMPVLGKLEQFGVVPPLHPLPALMGPPLGVVVLSTIALIQIRRSCGRLDGADHVYFAFTFSGLWLFAIYSVWQMIR